LVLWFWMTILTLLFENPWLVLTTTDCGRLLGEFGARISISVSLMGTTLAMFTG
jgi:hypothetical protein